MSISQSPIAEATRKDDVNSTGPVVIVPPRQPWPSADANATGPVALVASSPSDTRN